MFSIIIGKFALLFIAYSFLYFSSLIDVIRYYQSYIFVENWYR